jgi:hypothetical protein
VAFKVTYVGVSYESSAIIKESHSACLPDSPCPSLLPAFNRGPLLPNAMPASSIQSFVRSDGFFLASSCQHLPLHLNLYTFFFPSSSSGRSSS